MKGANVRYNLITTKLLISYIEYWLLLLVAEPNVQRDIIEASISREPSKRPTANMTLKHPIFWNTQKQLLFFQVCILVCNILLV